MAENTRTVLITGSGSGIGLASVKVFLSAGFNVIAHVRSGEVKLEENYNNNLIVVEADLSSKKEISKLCNVLKQYQIDVLVNNAAHYIYREDFLEIESNEIEELLGINVIAAMKLCLLVLPRMINNGWGRIINLSSISASHGGSAATVDYTISKAAIESLTRSLGKEYSKYNVLVNAIRVGVTDTKIHKLNPEKDLARISKSIPIGRLAMPNEIAEVIRFLATDDASYISGAIIPVTGGELT
jgi:3-oxoacyl-[acyl-carrier protein] reductase